MEENKVLETTNLIITSSNHDLLEPITEFYNKNKFFFQGYEGTRSENFYKIEYQKNQIDMDISKMKNLTGYRFWISLKDSNNIIGTFAFNNIILGDFMSCYLSYKMDYENINKGIMTEALKTGIQFAFQELNLHRIEANIMPENKASLRVAEKLGFVNEGIARKYLRINGTWRNHIHMVLLIDDFLKEKIIKS